MNENQTPPPHGVTPINVMVEHVHLGDTGTGGAFFSVTLSRSGWRQTITPPLTTTAINALIRVCGTHNLIDCPGQIVVAGIPQGESVVAVIFHALGESDPFVLRPALLQPPVTKTPEPELVKEKANETE